MFREIRLRTQAGQGARPPLPILPHTLLQRLANALMSEIEASDKACNLSLGRWSLVSTMAASCASGY